MELWGDFNRFCAGTVQNVDPHTIGMLVFEQGHLSRKNLSRTILASVNYLSSALVSENMSYFSFTLPRKTCQGKMFQGKLGSVYTRQVFLDKWTCQGKL